MAELAEVLAEVGDRAAVLRHGGHDRGLRRRRPATASSDDLVAVDRRAAARPRRAARSSRALGHQVRAEDDLLAAGGHEVGQHPPASPARARAWWSTPGRRVEGRVHVLEAGEVAADDDQVQVALVRLVVRRDRLAVRADDRERERLRAGRGPGRRQVEPVAVDLLGEPGRAAAVVVAVLAVGPVARRRVVGVRRRGLDVDGPTEPPTPRAADEDDGQPDDVRRRAGGCAQLASCSCVTPGRSRLPRPRRRRPRGRGVRRW